MNQEGYCIRYYAHWGLAQAFSRTKTKPKPYSKSISFWIYDRQAYVRPIMTCSEMPLLGTAHVPSNSILPWGVSLPADLLEAELNSNATTIASSGTYSLLGIIILDPTHMSETKM